MTSWRSHTTMYDCAIFHGSFGDPFGNWSPWLFRKLSGGGSRVLVPHLPGPQEQNFQNWSKIMDAYGDAVGSETDLIAHSLAPAFLASWIITRRKNVRNLYLVAPVYGLINIPEFDAINRSFFLSEVSLPALTRYAREIHCVYSDDDPYVPRSMSDDFAAKVGAHTTVVNKGKHLNE